MSLIGYADLDRPITFEFGRIFFPFGGGAFRLEPYRCAVRTSTSGLVEFQLEIIRAFSDRDSRATLACTIGADYASEQALARVREINPASALASCVLTDWWFRLLPSPVLTVASELTAPLLLASDGLGTARMMTTLSIETGLILESMLQDGGSLLAVAEAQFAGVSPRVPIVVRFDSSALLSELLDLADSTGALPHRLIVEYFGRELSMLPITISGTVDESSLPRFADTMADRIIARFGRYVPSQMLEDAPVVKLDRSSANASIVWSLSQPFLASRRLVLPVDLLSAAQAQIERLGSDAVIRRRTLALLPSFGQTRTTVLCNLPTSRAGVDALGVTLTFPPHPPDRPQARSATAVFESADDTATVEVRLSPNEPSRYRYSAFAVISDDSGTRQIDALDAEGEGSPLHLSSESFPVEFAVIEISPALGQLAIVSGTCSYELNGGIHARQFTLDSGQLSVGMAVPRERASVSVDAVAIARNGSGELRLGPFESLQVRLDLTSFPTYGPQQMDVRCVFDDSATLCAVSLLPMGIDESADNITTLALTPAEPVRTYRWFARSPFASGIQYRPFDVQGGAWTNVAQGSNPLVLYSSQLRSHEASREVAAKSRHGMREAAPRRPGRRTEAAATVAETAVVAVATSPAPEPTDELLYTRIADATRKLYVPRYVLDVQVVSGQQRYRISMAQGDVTSTLEVNLVAAPAPSLLDQAREAEEYPHSVTIHLDFLVAPKAGARKTLEFTDVTRNGTIVTARLTFATLAERDDVYRAMTDTERQARLVVRRFIDVSVPQRTQPLVILPVGTLPMTVLPLRPIQDWRTKRVGVQGAPIVDTPITALDSRPTLLASAAGSRPRLTESAAARSREANVLLQRKPTRFEPVVRPIDGGVLRPVDRFVETLPTPQLSFTSKEEEPGLTRFKLSVLNWAEFSDEFFAPSTDLPPCGRNQAASRTWIDIHDADSGTRLYGFCAISSAKQLTELWFAVPSTSPVPAQVRVTVTDRRAKVIRESNVVATSAPQPDVPPLRTIRHQLEQSVAPDPFTFLPALHGYMFQGLTPGSGSNQLIRYRFAWRGTHHTYLQDASRPSVVYALADQFKIARRRDTPFTPFATVRVTSLPDGGGTNVVFDYVVAPHSDPKRLEDARAQLLADPQFGASHVDFQPLLTSEVRFYIDRPVTSGAVRDARLGASVVLQGALKDTLSMPLDDFKLLWDAMHSRTASLFVGRVEIDVPNEDTEVIPFVARLDDLEGDLFSYEASSAPDGRVLVTVRNEIESPVNIQTLDATITRGGQAMRGLIQGTVLPHPQLLPGEAIQLSLAPESTMASTTPPEVIFDLSGVTVMPDLQGIWESILDRTTVDYFKMVTVKAITTLFDPVAGRESERILSILIDFEGGGTAELNASTPVAEVRIDYPIDDVILPPVSPSSTRSTYRYTVTLLRANGQQERDPAPRDGSAELFYVSVIR